MLPGSRGKDEWGVTTSFQDQKVVTSKLISWCVCSSGTWVHEMSGHWGLKQWRNALNLDIFFSYPLKCKIPINCSVCQEDRECRWLWGQIPWGEGPAHSGKLDWLCSSRRLQIVPDRNGHLFWTGFCISAGRDKFSKYYKRTKTEDTIPIWTAKSHFLRPRNTLSSPE